MNKLNETSSAKPRILSDGDLMQVVGGYGNHRWGGGNHGGGNHGGNNHGKNGNQGHALARQVVFNITINKTIINNTTFL